MKNSVLNFCIVLLFVALSMEVCSEENEIIRGPYLHLATQSSIIVRWKTSTAQNSVIRYGIDSTKLNNRIELSILTTDHEIDITQLEADTRYYYNLGEFGYSSDRFFET